MEQISKNWSQIRLRVNVKASIEKVYGAVATQEGLESWFLRSAEFTSAAGDSRKRKELLSKADQFAWKWHGFPDDTHLEGAVLEANGKDKFVFSFSMNCPVTVTIYREQDETIVELVEQNIPPEEGPIFKHYLSNTTGWTFYLVNLKSVLEGGLDLRNQNQDLKNVITA
jgi:uncharacterized protein YndB with AHSA1/START domain